MYNLIRFSGPYGPILCLLSLVVLFVTIRATWSLLQPSVPGGPSLKERLNALLFWGGVAAILGFLGQCGGSYQALSSILVAPEISPQIVAEGFVISFVPTLFGLGILGFALAAYSCLRFMARGRVSRSTLTGAAVFLFSLLFLGGCSESIPEELPESITDGVWSMEAGQDEFLWEFAETGGTITCLVHNIVGQAKLNETPCLTAELDGDRLRISMDTGVRLEGEVELGRGRIQGELLYPDGGSMEVELLFRPRERHTALQPLGETGRFVYQPLSGEAGGWPVASAAEVGIDPRALEETVAAVGRGDGGVLHSLLVARSGHLILEEYFHGYGPEDPHHLASCTKSVSSLLVGLAIEAGAIPGVEARVADFFPGNDDALGSGWDGLTLKHLLTMTMALDWSPEEAESLHGTGPEFFRRALSHSVAGSPGEDWAYVSADVNLLAGVLHQATGEHAEAFARQRLFEPLGFGAWNWDGMKTDGYNLMDGSLRLLPRDMAKLGQLVVEEGRWQGERVVPAEWIRESTALHSDTGDWPEGYGYLWWRTELPGPGGEPLQVIIANGWGSQFIFVLPSLELVLVTTGGNEYNGKHLAVGNILNEHLLPGVGPL